MTKEHVSKPMRYVSGDPRDRVIRFWAPRADGLGFHRMSSTVAAVDVMEVNEAASALVLRSGVVVPVAMPYEELEEKIYNADIREGVLDLCDVTGEVAMQIVVPELAKKIATEQGVQRGGIKIHALLRKTESNEQAMFDFFESDIRSLQPVATTRSKCDETVTIKFNSAVTKGPFGNDEANLDMPHEEFLRLIVDHQRRVGGNGVLDLVQLFTANPKKYGVNPL